MQEINVRERSSGNVGMKCVFNRDFMYVQNISTELELLNFALLKIERSLDILTSTLVNHIA